MTNLDRYDWQEAGRQLDERGHAILPGLLTDEQCAELATLYDDDTAFRSHIRMARHGFGRGEYKYLSYPLPSLVEALRQDLYVRLGPMANRWSERLGLETRYPERLGDFLDECHAAGQGRPTPLLLRYGKGDFNCLHRDLYGDRFFPLQVITLLNQPQEDFTGGELILVEQRPRMQSVGRVVHLERGDAAIIPVNYRPQRGTRGDYRLAMKHGVSEVTQGHRHTLGIIFHDAT